MTQDTIYQEHRKLINKKAYEAFLFYSVNYSELKAQANLIFCKTLKKHNKNISKFSTHLWHNLSWGLSEYAKNYLYENTHATIPQVRIFGNKEYLNSEWAIVNDSTEDRLFFEEDLNNLSSDAKKIVDFVFNPPDYLEGKKITKKCIMEYFRSTGWNIPKIYRLFGEIKSIL
jgi:hypothetical protein